MLAPKWINEKEFFFLSSKYENFLNSTFKNLERAIAMSIINLNRNASKEKQITIVQLYLKDIYFSIRISNPTPFSKVSF